MAPHYERERRSGDGTLMIMRLVLLPLLLLVGCTTPQSEPGESASSALAAAETPAPPADRGAELFATHCAVCHGPEGAGDGPGAAALDPAPSDLIGPRAEHLKGIPRRRIIEEGRPGTAMVGWKAILSPEDLDAVYGFVHDMKHGPDGQMKGGGGMRRSQATLRAQAAMKALGGSLKSQLVSTMKEQGPVAALEVCSSKAQSLTAEMSKERGVLMGRSSLKLRNPANSGPDWVSAWLRQQGARSADGVQGMTASATRADGTPVVRVLMPLAVEAPCLVCHGPDASRSAELSAVLGELYPGDQATGYALGDLRGAMWSEAALTE